MNDTALFANDFEDGQELTTMAGTTLTVRTAAVQASRMCGLVTSRVVGCHEGASGASLRLPCTGAACG